MGESMPFDARPAAMRSSFSSFRWIEPFYRMAFVLPRCVLVQWPEHDRHSRGSLASRYRLLTPPNPLTPPPPPPPPHPPTSHFSPNSSNFGWLPLPRRGWCHRSRVILHFDVLPWACWATFSPRAGGHGTSSRLHHCEAARV